MKIEFDCFDQEGNHFVKFTLRYDYPRAMESNSDTLGHGAMILLKEIPEALEKLETKSNSRPFWLFAGRGGFNCTYNTHLMREDNHYVLCSGGVRIVLQKSVNHKLKRCVIEAGQFIKQLMISSGMQEQYDSFVSEE